MREINHYFKEKTWLFRILEKIEKVHFNENVQEKSELFAVAKKCAYLIGMTEAVDRVKNANCIENELYHVKKNVDYEWMEVMNPSQDTQPSGVMKCAYLEGMTNIVKRLKGTDCLKAELHKIDEELEIEWGSHEDAYLQVKLFS